MTRRLLPIVFFLLPFFLACARSRDGREQREWRAVLELKRRYAAASATGSSSLPAARQAWADAVADFMVRYPSHARAKSVYAEMQLEFARELMKSGRTEDAIRYYRAVVAANADAADARQELAAALQGHRIDRTELASIPVGMSASQVSERFGNPPPGWVHRVVSGGKATECWYYPAASEGLAAVFFAEGKVFATEYPGTEKRRVAANTR